MRSYALKKRIDVHVYCILNTNSHYYKIIFSHNGEKYCVVFFKHVEIKLIANFNFANKIRSHKYSKFSFPIISALFI